MTTNSWRARCVCAAWVMTLSAWAAKPEVILPGLQLDGSVLLPNQWSLRPVGRQVVVGDFPSNVAPHPRGRFAAVLHSGWGQHEVRILEVKSGRLVSQVALGEPFYGLAWSPAGQQLIASGAGTEVIPVYAFADGQLSTTREM